MAVLIVGVVLVAVVDVALIAVTRRTTIRVPDFLALRALMVAAWLWCVVPGTYLYVAEGRPDLATLSTITDPTGRVAQVVWLLNGLVLSTALVAAFHYSAGSRPGVGPVAVLLVPWALMLVGAWTQDAVVSVPVLFLPLIAVAIWRAAPPLRVFATLGWLVAATAVGSLALGFLRPEAGTLQSAVFADKVPFLDAAVLAGPFSHPNMLGSFLALGLPTVLLIQARRARTLGVVFVGWAVLWSASRTSIATVAVVLIVAWATRMVRTASNRKQGAALGLLAVVAVLAWVPLTHVTPRAFNGRGRVWAGSLDRWAESPMFGLGPDAYRTRSSYLGDYAFHGHNLLVDGLLTGGLLYLAVLAVLVALVGAWAVRAFAAGAVVPLTIVVAFLVDGVLEVSTNFWLPSPTSFVVWLSLSAVLFATRTDKPTEAEHLRRRVVASQSSR